MKLDSEWVWRNTGWSLHSEAKAGKDAFFNTVDFLLDSPPDGFEEFVLRTPGIQELVAMNPKTDAGLLRKLFEVGSEELWFYLGPNPSMPVDVLVELGERSVANNKPRGFSNPSMPASMLVKHFNKVGGQIAENPAASPEMLWRVVKEFKNTQINIHLAQNPNLPHDLAEHLYGIGFGNIRSGLASNPVLHRDILDELMKGSSYSKNILESTSYVDVLVKHLREPSGNLYTAEILRNPALSRDVLLEVLPEVDQNHALGLLEVFSEDGEVLKLLWGVVKNNTAFGSYRGKVLRQLMLLPECEGMPQEWVEAAF